MSDYEPGSRYALTSGEATFGGWRPDSLMADAYRRGAYALAGVIEMGESIRHRWGCLVCGEVTIGDRCSLCGIYRGDPMAPGASPRQSDGPEKGNGT